MYSVHIGCADNIHQYICSSTYIFLLAADVQFLMLDFQHLLILVSGWSCFIDLLYVYPLPPVKICFGHNIYPCLKQNNMFDGGITLKLNHGSNEEIEIGLRTKAWLISVYYCFSSCNWTKPLVVPIQGLSLPYSCFIQLPWMLALMCVSHDWWCEFPWVKCLYQSFFY